MIEIWTSKNGIDFHSYGSLNNTFGRNEKGAHTLDFKHDNKGKAQFIKVKLTYPGDCPEWHLGKGGKSWIFLDEIVID